MRIIKPINHKSSGFTLIELLIASVLGIVVIGSVITVFATTVRYNSDNLQMIRLNQELRGVMSLISRDLKRAGYFNSAAVTTTYLDTFGGADTGSYLYNDCVYFAYDIDADGVAEDSDFIAYKLLGSEINQGTGSGVNLAASPPDFDCNTNVTWEALTEYDPGTDDRSDIQITQLQFEPECSNAGGAVASDFICTGTGVEVRNMVITITGQVITPVDNTVVSRTLTETIKLRNDSGV
jgi:type II secretory pathway component PulJ